MAIECPKSELMNPEGWKSQVESLSGAQRHELHTFSRSQARWYRRQPWSLQSLVSAHGARISLQLSTHHTSGTHHQECELVLNQCKAKCSI